jgi:bifunctional DNase/RNase
VITSLGARLVSVVISDLVEEVYYARLVLDIDGRHVEVDSRPSDAIALAVRAKAPIYVEDEILEQSGVKLEQAEDSEPPAITLDDEEQSSTPTADIKDENLDAYRDFINTLDVLDDFGKE